MWLIELTTTKDTRKSKGFVRIFKSLTLYIMWSRSRGCRKQLVGSGVVRYDLTLIEMDVEAIAMKEETNLNEILRGFHPFK